MLVDEPVATPRGLLLASNHHTATEELQAPRDPRNMRGCMCTRRRGAVVYGVQLGAG